MMKAAHIYPIILLLLATQAVAQGQATPQGQWVQKEVSYDWPGIEGLTQQMSFGFFVTPQSRVVRQAVSRNGQVYNADPNTGIVVFDDVYPVRRLTFSVHVQFNQNYYRVVISEKGSQKSKVIDGFLALSDEEILAEIISLSKSDKARESNAQMDVSDFGLSRAILFAAHSYDIPVKLFTALVYQESKFSVGYTSGDIRGLAQVSYDFAVQECEHAYFKSDDFLARVNKNAQIRPNKDTWDSVQDNLLYGAAYLRFLYLDGFNRLAKSSQKSLNISQHEYWKFVLVFYNAGIGEGLRAMRAAYAEELKLGQAIVWKPAFEAELAKDKSEEYQKEKRNYARSIYFYIERLTNGDRNLRQ